MEAINVPFITFSKGGYFGFHVYVCLFVINITQNVIMDFFYETYC